MLPVTFHHDAGLRLSKSALGIFAVALLTAGFSFTALLCFAVRSPLFQAESIFLPCLLSCAIGLLTIFYNFLISSKFYWNTPALLLTIAASISTLVYAGLLVFTQRKASSTRPRTSPLRDPSTSVPMRPASMSSAGGTLQDPTYQEIYIRNMHPTSLHNPQPMGYDPNSITEEEMQRQQMLMLLLQKEQPPTPDPSQSTFHIDWQGRDEEDVPPNGYYAPQPQTAYPPQSALLSREWTAELRPWDGVWRGPPPPQTARGRLSSQVEQWQRASSWERREERRREIEMGQ